MRNAPAAIVAGEPESRKAERAHHLDLVRRHRALRVVDVLRAAVGLRRIAVAAQVAADDGVALREPRRDPMPHRVRLRIAVQQEERRTAAADDAMNLRAGRRDAVRSKPGKSGAATQRSLTSPLNRPSRRTSSRRPPTSRLRPSPAPRTPPANRRRSRRRVPASFSRTSGMLSAFTISALSRLTISGGVPAGANTPCHEPTSKPGNPDSASVGTSGAIDERLAVVTASARSLPALASGQRGRDVVEGHRHLAAHHVLQRRRAALVGNVLHLGARHRS